MIKYKNTYREGKVKNRIPTITPVVSGALTLKDIARIMFRRTGIPEADTIVLMEEFGEELVRQLQDGKQVTVDGLGVFSVDLKNESGEVRADRIVFSSAPKVKQTIRQTPVKPV